MKKSSIIIPKLYTSKEAYCVHTYFFCIFFSFIDNNKMPNLIDQSIDPPKYSISEDEKCEMYHFITYAGEDETLPGFAWDWRQSAVKARLARNEKDLEHVMMDQYDILKVSTFFFGPHLQSIFNLYLKSFCNILTQAMIEDENSFPLILLRHAAWIFFHKLQGIHIDPRYPENSLSGRHNDVYLGY